MTPISYNTSRSEQKKEQNMKRAIVVLCAEELEKLEN